MTQVQHLATQLQSGMAQLVYGVHLKLLAGRFARDTLIAIGVGYTKSPLPGESRQSFHRRRGPFLVVRALIFLSAKTI